MTEIRVDTIVDAAGTGAPNFTTAPTVGGVALGSLATSSFTSSGTAPSSPSNGAVWWDTTNSALMIYVNSAWQTVTLGVIPPGPVYFGDRAMFTLGNLNSSPWQSNLIKYYDLDVGATVNTFGNLSTTNAYVTGASGGGRGLFAGGSVSGTGVVNKIEYVTISSTGNTTDFGDLTEVSYTSASASNGEIAIYAMNDNNKTSLIQEVTIDTAGNATAWSGTLTQAKSNGCGASDGTKGFFFGGRTASSSTQLNEIDYVTIATDANASDWGNLGTARKDTGGNSACGTSSRILIGGGTTSSSISTSSIEYINPASASNAYSFGNLGNGLRYCSSTNNETHAIWMQGLNNSSQMQQYAHRVQIDSAGNASIWATTGAIGYGSGALSGAHS
jgi:hypothetical protein